MRTVLHWVPLAAGFLLWGLLLLPLAPFYDGRGLFWLSRLAFRWILRSTGIRIAAEGVGALDPQKGYVYVFNHASFLDHFVFSSQVPGFVIGLEKASNFRIPVYGRITKWWGNVPIVREDRSAAIRAIQHSQGVLAMGTSICVAPEGTRSRDGKVGPFKKGGFVMAREMRAPIVPVTILNMDGVNPDGRFRLRSGVVRLLFHAPLRSDDDRPIEALVEAVRDTICGTWLTKREG